MTATQRLHGRKALVTGAETGIGREIALELARQGAAVALHYPLDESGAASAVEEVRRGGGAAVALRADFRELDRVRDLAHRAIEHLGGLDVLVNNAGITMNMPFDKVTPEQYDTLYGVNIRGQFFLTQAVLGALVASGSGAIVNVASIHAFEGLPQHTVYAGTKGAIVAYTRALAIELAMRGVRVNAVAPGAVPVENYKTAGFDAPPEVFNDLIPIGYPADKLDVARAVVFLASDDARSIVGHTLVIDGGTTAWMPFSNAFKQPFSAQFGRGYVPGL